MDASEEEDRSPAPTGGAKKRRGSTSGAVPPPVPTTPSTAVVKYYGKSRVPKPLPTFLKQPNEEDRKELKRLAWFTKAEMAPL